MRYDLAIAGGGSAGAALAAIAAERGMRVLLLERGPLGAAGARWVNDVPAWMLAAAGVAPPAGDELIPASPAAHLLAGEGPRRVVIRGFDVPGVDMRLLGARLQRRALEAGAHLREGVRVLGRGRRRLETSQGEVDAEWLVDAAGLAGAGLLPRPSVARGDICAAAQEMRRVKDAGLARAFFERHGAAPDEALSFLGAAGGFSTLSVRLVRGELFLLAGTIPARGHPSGAALVDAFAAKHSSWVGAPIFGGRRAIPLRYPFERLADERAALLGDAASQVFAGHGSGVGAGLLAARILADALAEGRGPRGYGVSWQRAHGALFAAYDLFRRAVETLDAADLARLMESGILSEGGMRAGVLQRWPEISAREVPGVLAGAIRLGPLGRRFAALAGRAAALRLHYARYPEEERALPAWTRTLRRVLGLPLEEALVEAA